MNSNPTAAPFGTVLEETLELSEHLFELGSRAGTRLPKVPRAATFWSLSGGTAFVDYLLTFLRNPLLDPGHGHGLELHYETLDKFWDSRPGLVG